MKLYCPRWFDGKKPENYDEDVEKYYAKLNEIQETAVDVEYEPGDFYDEMDYTMPDGSVWRRVINTEYNLEYSLEEV